MTEYRRRQERMGTEAASETTTLMEGEIAYATDTRKLKVSDGSKTYDVTTDNVVSKCTDHADQSEALSLAWWLARAGADEITLRVPKGTHYIGGDVSVPSNIALRFDKGAVLNIAAGHTLTINGAVEAGLWRIFGGEGEISGFGSNTEIYSEWFGAAGDYDAENETGTDDTAAIVKAMDVCRRSGRLLKFEPKTYCVKAASVPEKYRAAVLPPAGGAVRVDVYASSMKGQRTTVVIDGYLRFLTDKVDAMYCANIEFRQKNSYNKDTSYASMNILFYAKDSDSKKSRCTYRNLRFIGMVENPADYSTLTTCGTAIWECFGSNSLFTDIYTKNYSVGIIVEDGRNYKVQNVTSECVDTCLWLQGSSYDVENIRAVNDYARGFIWVNKNNAGALAGSNGKDVVLCGGEHYTLRNIYGENMPERVIYSQGSHVTASDLKALNCGGFKFVGTAEKTASDVQVSNAHLVVDTDGYADKRHCEFTQIYWMEDVKFFNCSFTSRNADGTGGSANGLCISVGRHAKNVTIDGFVHYGNVGALVGVVLADSDEGRTEDEDYIVLENAQISGCKIIADNARNFSFFAPYTGSATETALTKYAARNVVVKDCYIDAITEDASQLDSFFYSYLYCDGFRGINNSTKLPFARNIPTSTTETVCVARDVILYEPCLLVAPSGDTLLGLLNSLEWFPLSGGSLLRYIVPPSVTGIGGASVEVLTFGEGAEPLIVKYNSEITIKTTGGFSAVPIEGTVRRTFIGDDGSYYEDVVSGGKTTVLFGTKPANLKMITYRYFFIEDAAQ